MLTYTNARALEDLPLFFPDHVLSAVVKNALKNNDTSYRQKTVDIHPIAQSHAEDSSSPVFNCRRLIITYRRGDDRKRIELDTFYVTRPKKYKQLMQIYDADRWFYLELMPELERHISWPGICPKLLMITHRGSVMVFENPAVRKFEEVHEPTWSGLQLHAVARAMARLQAAGMRAQRANGGRPLYEKFPRLLAEKKPVHEAEEVMQRYIKFIETIARDKLRLSTKWIKRVIIDGWLQVRDWDDSERPLKMSLAHTRTWCSEILLNDWYQPNALFKSFDRVRYGPLTLDLVQFVYVKCWKWVRSDPESFRKLIKAYREQLRRSLIRDFEEHEIPSREAIADEFEELEQAGLHYAALYVPSQAIDNEATVVSVAKDSTTNQRQLLERLKRLQAACHNDQLKYYRRSSSYRERINEVVREIVRFGEKKYEKPEKARKEYFQQIIYGPSESWQDENTKDTKITSSSETILHGLKKFTNYSMQILAFTSGGDGVKSAPIHCQTEQDAPEAPTAIKALVMSASAILVSWRPPSQPNGVISQYTVYWKGNASEQPSSQKVSPTQLTHEVSSLEETRKYDFWVTASTNIGEGQPSKVVNLAPSASIPAKIASFDDKFVATYKEDVKLPCLAVGVPAPEVTWKVRGVKLAPTDRLRQLPEGSLFIKEVDRTDAGEYSCYVENTFGHDTVTHQLVVHAPPHSPQVTLTATTTNSLTMKLRPHQNDNAPIHGYTIHYKPEFGDWETVQISSTSSKYTLENLWCGSRYQIYVTAYNTIGMGEPSDILNTRTKGSKPIIPEASRFIEVSTKSITLHLHAWSDGGCPIIYFVVEHKKKHSQEWNQVSNNVKPGGNFVVMDLDAATWYHLRVTANNNPGSAVAEYEFATLTVTGSTIAPARELPDLNASDSSDDPMKIFMANLNLVVPVVAAVLVIIVAVIVICVLKGKAHEDEKDDVVYQQTGPIGATLDKRRPDLRDELGYIAPPNRKLPPVPGSNYNTCDRIKRGTVISRNGSARSYHQTWDPRRHMYEELSHYAPNRRCPPPPPGAFDQLNPRSMEDEICPYATFHLLGFREEMDPSKAMQFQTFPHPVNGHTATMGPAVGHPNNSSAHSRSGSQSMPRQANGGRYSRVPSQGGSTGGNQNIFTPEYDDPANCNPEEDYGSQYGQYGAPYDHYGSRGSVGRRSVGSLRNLPVSNSPEPPPPPPRNHDQSNSSFNDSKESTDVNDQDDRDQLIRNYGGNSHGKDAKSVEEMRKLIERNEGSKQSTFSSNHSGLISPYDTVAV